MLQGYRVRTSMTQEYAIALFSLVLGLGGFGAAFSFWWDKRHAEKLFLGQIARLEERLKDALDRVMSRDIGEYAAIARPEETTIPSLAFTRDEEETALAAQMFGEWEPGIDSLEKPKE